jgi:colanic acid/amylovoran biosynthesis glycosyltransferase
VRIAFLVGQFPLISETFVLAQIVAMLEKGHSVDIYAERPLNAAAKVHDDVSRLRLLDQTHYWPPSAPSSFPTRVLSAVGRMARYGLQHPLVAIDSINPMRYGRDALTLRLVHERLPLVIKDPRYDVIHCHYGPNGQRAVNLRRGGLLRGPIITTFHGFDANWVPRRYGNDVYRRLFADGELFTVGSEFMRRRILSLGASAERIIKLPMGVDLRRFAFQPRHPTPGEPVQILAVARLVEVKGIEYLLRALAVVRRTRADFVCVIAGDGPLRADLEKLADELGAGSVVQFRGAVSGGEVSELYRAAHMLVLPSIVTESGEEENQPVVIAEAQACGIPVIGTSIGGVGESLRDRESGLLVPPRDPQALAQAILWMLDHASEWPRLGAAGRRHVEENYDLTKLNDALEETYRKLAEASASA